MKQVLFLGDSITDCNHCFDPENLGYGYVRKIFSKLNASNETAPKYQVINKGNDGFTVSSVLRLWKSTASSLSPDFITILIGINDLAVMKNTGITESIALAEFRLRYLSLISEIRKSFNGPILLMEPFIFPSPAEYISWEADLAKMNGIIREIAKAEGLRFLPLWEDFLSAAKSEGFRQITTDGIHLTENGQEIIAQKWLENFFIR